MEEYSTKLLQRAFRGFSGRSLWRRLKMRFAEEKRQKDMKKQVGQCYAIVVMCVAIGWSSDGEDEAKCTRGYDSSSNQVRYYFIT